MNLSGGGRAGGIVEAPTSEVHGRHKIGCVQLHGGQGGGGKNERKKREYLGINYAAAEGD